ncbi:MAG: ribonuclease III [Acidobacteria bacterium]|nr:ribonuclease III [Acidobacteriota bacterium]
MVAVEDAGEAARLLEAYRQPPDGRKVVLLRDELAPLERRLGHLFADRRLLQRALTHRSRAHEDGSGAESTNESLEFLGDAVLGFVIAEVVFREFPEADEGQKSKVKATLVSAVALAKVAERLELGHYLRLGRGEQKTGGRRKPVLLADACEAVIAAVYLDGGIDAARALILRETASLLEDTRALGIATAGAGDFKSALQEYLQARRQAPPIYLVAAEAGPDHDKRFTIEVHGAGRLLAQAGGRSKKDAEQQAARLALEGLRDCSVDLDDAAGR